MPIRKILLPLTSTIASEAALTTALLIAQNFEAYMLALHVQLDSREVAPLVGEGLSGAMIEEMMTATEQESALRRSSVRVAFEQAVQRHQVALTQPQAGAVGANFLSLVGREDEIVAQQARLADLTVVPHPEAGDDISSSDALHAVLFDSGRPVLIAPPKVPASIGTRVCIAWNGTAESAAALQTALPWLLKAEAVRVLWSEDYQRTGPLVPELLEYLGLYGIAPDVARFDPIERDVGAGLLAAAREWGADLLTMGAYSHSRLRQLILGGVTRHVLERSDLPVLMNR